MIPIRFEIEEPGYVTLVVEDSSGKRVRNLISETKFSAGQHVVWWDGMDDVDRQRMTDNTYRIDAKPVEPGNYQIRGLVRPEIELTYEFTPYNPGIPPWASNDRASHWLSDHRPPSTILYVPGGAAPERERGGGDGQILVGSTVAEAGDGLVWLDIDGRKIWGQKWIGGVWSGSAMLARDEGDNAVPGVYAYSATGWPGGGYDGAVAELRLAELLSEVKPGDAPRDDRLGSGEDRPLLSPRSPYSGMKPSNGSLTELEQDMRFAFPNNESVGVGGLAVRNGLLVVSLSKLDQLLFVDARARRIIGLEDLEDPRGLAFDRDGALLVLSGQRLLRFKLLPDAGKLSAPEAVVDGLEDPMQVLVGKDGVYYISDQGSSHQVKVFDQRGQLLRSIGKPGVPTAGRYDPKKMNHPNGITLDGDGRLWVAEEDFYPKRVSVWKTDGTLVDAFYGPRLYGGGGTLDPEDRTRFFYDGMEFRLDWEAGTSELVSVLMRRSAELLDLKSGEMSEAQKQEAYRADPLRFPKFNHQRPASPETPFHVNGRTYLTNAYTTQPTNGTTFVGLWLLRDGVAVPVAASGVVNDWPLFELPEFEAILPDEYDPLKDKWTAYWSDRNADGIPQPEEMFVRFGRSGPITVQPDLTFISSETMAYRYDKISSEGVPHYDFSKGQTIVPGARQPITSGGGMVITAPENWTLLSVPPEPYGEQSGVSGAKDGVPLWNYPSLWPGLHPSHHAPLPQHPGQIIGHTRIIGPAIVPRGGEAGALWALNGDKGNVYLMTSDGLFVATLWQDSRKASWDAETADRGMSVSNLSLEQEAFYTTMTQTKQDGKIYFVASFSGSLVSVQGLDRIKRLPVRKGELTASMISGAVAAGRQQTNAALAAKAADAGPMIAEIRDQAPVVDGDFSDWNGAKFVKIDAGTRAAIAFSGDHLYAAFETKDKRLLSNDAQSFPILFKGGGGLDLMLETNSGAKSDRKSAVEGDLRLLVSKLQGKTTAVLYRPVVSRRFDRNPYEFASPVRRLVFDSVENVSDQVKLEGKDGRFEFSIPLETLKLEVSKGSTLRGDIGILRGNGSKTLERVYWSNKSTAITSDVPAEAELAPARWGQIEIR